MARKTIKMTNLEMNCGKNGIILMNWRIPDNSITVEIGTIIRTPFARDGRLTFATYSFFWS